VLLYDALAMRFREIRIRRDPACPLCGANPTITGLREYSMCCATPILTDTRPPMNCITVEELKAALDTQEKICLIDVREPSEFQLCRIPASKLIPLGELPARVGELDRNADIVVHCKAGGRSAKACEFLATQGFKKVRNVTGGILAWAERIDPSVPKY
jgi:adenylyltransferase/sulfurtransferase